MINDEPKNSTETVDFSDSFKPQILIVDDNPANLGVLSDYLKDYGFRILAARSGDSALKKLEHIQPDIILMDVMMPGIDGFETCQQIKANEKTKDIPVIFMTALAETGDKVKGFKAGGVDYITKPLQHEEVLARVTTHLRIRDLTYNLQKQNLRLQEITKELQTTNANLSKRALQLETSSQVSQRVTSILSLDELLMELTRVIRSKFRYYFIGIWLLDPSRQNVILQTGDGPAHLNLPEPGLSLLLDTPNNIIALVSRTGKPYLSANVHTDPIYQANGSPYGTTNELSDIRSELVLPLRIAQKVIGVLDIQSDQLNAFDQEDKTVLEMLANQIAIAIRNAQLYQAEEEKSQMLTSLNADKDRFFSIVSHDLRGPFQGLLGYSELLLMTIDVASKETIKNMGEKIHQSAKSTFNLLENLLQWSLIQRGRMPCSPTKINLTNLANDTVHLLQANATEKNIHLFNKIEGEIFGYADRHMIDTVIRNLTSNAIKFTSSGGQISISAENQDNFVQVTVSDTGIGIGKENINKLFRVDTHYTTSGTAEEDGSGLGLILCKEMIEKNKGRIWMESEIGQGTAVKFTVPISSFSKK